MSHHDALPRSVSQWLNSIVRHWFMAILSFLTIVALTVAVIIYAPREYRSTARLLLRIGHESATLEPTVAITGDTITPLHTREDEIETAIGVMHSRLIMEQVVDQAGMDVVLQGKLKDQEEEDSEEPGMVGQWLGAAKAKMAELDPVPDRELAIRKLEKGLSISAPTKSSVVTIEYAAKDPEVARNIVSLWVDNYLGQHSKVNRTQGTFEFFSKQDVELKEQLDQAHGELRDAKNRGSFVTLEGQQKLLEAQLDAVRANLLTVEADLAESSTRIEATGKLLSTAIEATTTEEVSGIANEAHDEMRSLLFQLEVLEKEYSAKYKDTHPKLLAVRDQLANAMKIVKAQERDRTQLRQSANPTFQTLSESRLIDMASQDALKQRKETMLAQQEGLLQEIAELNNYEAELARLTRNVTVLEERYAQHAVRLEQARLDEVLEESRITSINVIQPATLEQRPITPNKKICGLAGLFAAIAMAVSIPVLLDLRHPPTTSMARNKSVSAVDRAGLAEAGAAKERAADQPNQPREQEPVVSAAATTAPAHPR